MEQESWKVDAWRRAVGEECSRRQHGGRSGQHGMYMSMCVPSHIQNKYIGIYDVVLNDVLAKFFSYLYKVWIDSAEIRWYEGADPWQIPNNQGVEGKNREIKLNHTFRRKLEIGELIASCFVRYEHVSIPTNY